MNTRSSTREDSVSFSLRDLAAPLFRRKRVLIVTFLFVFAAVTWPACCAAQLHRIWRFWSVANVWIHWSPREATTQMLNMTQP